jgi:hypothetical protein
MWMKDSAPRWTQLFDDLESQADALGGAEEFGEIAERTRIETGRLGLVDRLRPVQGQVLGLRCAGVGVLTGRLEWVGVDCVLLSEPSSAESLVPVAAILALTGVSRWSDAAAGQVHRRLGFRSALRRLARDRVGVRIRLIDGGSMAGTVDRVGLDHLELAEHPTGEPRRAASVLRVWTIPLLGVAVVRRAVV